MLCAEYSDSDEDVIPSSVTAPPVATPASFTTALATINAAPAIEEKVRVAICCCLSPARASPTTTTRGGRRGQEVA